MQGATGYDYFVTGSSSRRGRMYLARTVLPHWAGFAPRRYATLWQTVMWILALLLALRNARM